MAGIENQGFQIKTFDEIRNEIEQGLRQRLGPEINLESTSILGNLVAIEARQLSDLWQLGANTYGSRHIQTANGQSIDRIVELLGIRREPERRTSGVAYAYGIIGTTLPLGTSFSTASGLIYETTTQVEMIEGQTPILTFKRNPGVGLDSFNISQFNNLYGLFESESGEEFFSINYSDDISQLEQKFTAFFGSGVIASITRDVNNFIVVNFARKLFLPFFQSTGMTIEVTRPGLVDGVAVNVENVLPGDIVTNRGELRTIESPVQGMEGVVNFTDFERGRLREDDRQLRQKWFNRVGSPVSASPLSLRRELLKINGVLQAIAFEGSDGPGTVEMVIYGGDDTEIAQSLYDNKIIGIEYVGNSQDNATDEQGSLVRILFSRPTIINFDVRVDIVRLDNFPLDGVEQIKNLLQSFGENFLIGRTLRPTPDMIWALQSVTGLNSLVITLRREGEGQFGGTSLTLSNRQRPNFENILVYENGTEL